MNASSLTRGGGVEPKSPSPRRTGCSCCTPSMGSRATASPKDEKMSDGSELYLCLGEEKASEALMTQCINDNEEAGCDNKINEQLSANFNGEFIPKPGGPGSCSSVNWMCDGKNYRTDKTTYEAECKVDCTTYLVYATERQCIGSPNSKACRAYTACKRGN